MGREEQIQWLRSSEDMGEALIEVEEGHFPSGWKAGSDVERRGTWILCGGLRAMRTGVAEMQPAMVQAVKLGTSGAAFPFLCILKGLFWGCE